MKIANPNPTHCAACFQQKPGMRHIDFEAYFDGPVIDTANGMKQCIDDLVICEECLVSAAGRVGMVKDDEAAEKIAKLEKENGELRALRARNALSLQKVKKALGVPA